MALEAQQLAPHLSNMKELCERAGRDFGGIEISVLFLQQPELQPSDPLWLPKT